MLVFVPMVIGMAGVFFPVNSAVYAALPVAGQQVQISQWLSGRPVELLPSLLLSSLTIAVAAAVLRVTALLLERDEAIYGR
jgi:hypothetical protein